MRELDFSTHPDRGRAVEIAVDRFEHGHWRSTGDEVATEEPLEIQVNGQSLAVIMRTPGDDAYLAIGFLLSEGIIRSVADLVGWNVGSDRDGYPNANTIEIRLNRATVPRLEGSTRQFIVSSSCGRCGTATIEAALALAEPIALDLSGQTVEIGIIIGLDEKLRARQAIFSRTGGLHAAGLFDRSGNLLAVHEDVGRHNAVDKIVGEQAIAHKLPLSGTTMLVSGRVSFELVQKATIAGIPILAAVGAPSSLAVEMARASRLTLVGMLRGGRLVVYSYPERILDSMRG